ncbi:class I SAM-dependent methyltransferase [Lipingzhangella sp. LS1_29]|uniref:Class I SAM-dependent methyltransferase n=1 Tax=Lipingzhangella rawalii TaxID=2055835 RepID=A0ABU2H337_9ACTN|nr:class I SAM-dependent methyltransferase [Lipingzhangella rawalii]MDS1269716.1 class I SAM-dependent methyltransferase [Lipingzhangella rawalii]
MSDPSEYRHTFDFDVTDPALHAALKLHQGLTRQGPGSTETTRTLMELAHPLPERPRALDLGCGPGPATLLLVREANAEVTALDIYQPFLEELRSAAERAGLAQRIHPENRSMRDLDYPDHSFDVVWAEGSAYNIGFDTALLSWKRLIAPGGVLVVTECGWIVDHPDPAAREFWDELYPLRSTADNVAAATWAGYTVTATYLLPDRDWFTEYYTPLEHRIARVDPADTLTAQAAEALRREIDLRRRHGASYGYVGYVLRPHG